MSTAVHGTTSVHSAFAVQERFKCKEAFCRLAGEETGRGEKIIYCAEKRDTCQEDVEGEIGKHLEMEKRGTERQRKANLGKQYETVYSQGGNLC